MADILLLHIYFKLEIQIHPAFLQITGSAKMSVILLTDPHVPKRAWKNTHTQAQAHTIPIVSAFSRLATYIFGLDSGRKVEDSLY